MDDHAYTIRTITRPRHPIAFRAACACGWVSEPKSSAGLAHGAHDDHAATPATDTDTDR